MTQTPTPDPRRNSGRRKKPPTSLIENTRQTYKAMLHPDQNLPPTLQECTKDRDSVKSALSIASAFAFKRLVADNRDSTPAMNSKERSDVLDSLYLINFLSMYL